MVTCIIDHQPSLIAVKLGEILSTTLTVSIISYCIEHNREKSEKFGIGA